MFRRRGADAELAEELAQRCWTVAWETLAAGRFDESRATLSTFVYAIAQRVWLQRFRGRRAVPPEAARAERVDASPVDALLHAELLSALRGCLGATAGPLSLTAEERDIIESSAAGRTERELAARLRMAASTVNARKKTALEKLKQCLTSKGFPAEIVEQAAGQAE